jgi:hypothetical protein
MLSNFQAIVMAGFGTVRPWVAAGTHKIEGPATLLLLNQFLIIKNMYHEIKLRGKKTSQD